MTEVIVGGSTSAVTIEVDTATAGSLAAAARAESAADRAEAVGDMVDSQMTAIQADPASDFAQAQATKIGQEITAQGPAIVSATPVIQETVAAMLDDSDRMQGYAAAAASKVVIPSLPGGRNADGTRRIPQLLTCSFAPTLVTNVTAHHQRHPFQKAADIRRARIHIRNYNLYSETAQTGAINFTGVYFGAAATTSVGALNGLFSGTPTKVLGAFSTPADGSEYVSDWFDLNYTAYTQGMFSFGWTAASGQPIYRSRMTTWYTGTPADAGVVNPSGLTSTATTYFDIVVEVEVSATVRSGLYGGDSLLFAFDGGGDPFPVGDPTSIRPQIVVDAWPERHALQHGHLPMLFGFSGSKLADFDDVTAWKWTRWSGMSKPDFGFMGPGSNDLYDATSPAADLTTMQSRATKFIQNVRTVFTKNNYAQTILPRNSSNPPENHAPKDALRNQYNDWLRTLPLGLMNVFDFDEAMRDPADPSRLRPGVYGNDGTHLTHGGARRQANIVNAPLINVALSLPAPVVSATPVLDTYAGATAAYSMRQLRSAYGGACVRLRRSSDNAEADFGFIALYLNKAAVLAWAGSGDAFVVTWYDQSGAGKHMTQATQAAQPRIVTAGVFTAGTKVAPRFDGTDDYLFSSTALGLWAAGAASILGVVSGVAQQSKGILSEGNSATAQGQYTLQTGDSTDATRAKTSIQTQSGTALGTANAAGVFDGTVHHFGWIDTGSNNIVRKDETASTGVSYSRSGATLTPNQAAIGAIPRSAVSGFYAGDVFELIAFPTALDATTRAAIAANQRSYYGAP